MTHRGLLLVLSSAMGTLLGAQDRSRLVEGTVCDEAGAPIAGAHVRLEVCNGPWLPGVLAAELAGSPLPATRSTAKGAFALVMAPVHDRFDAEIHGQLALVVEADGRQPWRELLPGPPVLCTGSDVVLPALRDADRATVKVVATAGNAFVRVRRIDGDHFLQQGGPPQGEHRDLPVPANGLLTVHVPPIPNPPSVPCTDHFAPIGWTAQLVGPGRTSEPQPITAGDVLEFAPTGAPLATQPARAANGEPRRIARCLHRLADGSLHWFPAVDGGVADDTRLPVVAIELADPPHQGLVLPWPGPVPELPDTAPRELCFVDPAGALVDDVHVGLFAPAALVWKRERLRPLLPAAERLVARRGTVRLPDPVTARPTAWITAPRHLPLLVLDVRTLRDGGRVVLQPAPRTVFARVQDDQGRPIADVFAFSCPRSTAPDRAVHEDAPWLRADGGVPRTDAEGRCVLPASADWPYARFTAPGWQFAIAQYDERTNTLATVGTPVQAWRARAVSAGGRPVPFANLGAEVWTYAPDGSSSAHFVAAMADSRGIATFLATEKPPKITAGELGGYTGPATELAAAGTTDVRVADDPFVAVLAPADKRAWAHCVFGWRGAGRTLGGTLRTSAAMLFRWPASLPLWAREADGPPIAVAVDEARARPLHVIDRRKIVRETPLRLTGDVPADLAGLRTYPAAIARCEIFGSLDAEYLRPGRDRLVMQTRDELQYDVWVAHPETLPARARIARGAAGRDETTAALVRGAPCTLVVRLARPLREHEQLLLTVRMTGFLGRQVGVVVLHDDRLRTDEVTRGIELQAPFALPPGRLQVVLSTSDLQPATVEVDGTTPVRVEFRAAQ